MYLELPTISTGLEVGKINIRTDEINIDTANLIKFSCISRADCCSSLRIPVTEFDIQRIEDHGYELDQIIDSLSPIILPSKTFEGKTEKAYSLKRKPFDGTCTFLSNNLCTIHKYKPFACQIYPYSLEIQNELEIKIVIHTEEICKSIKPATYLESNNKALLMQLIASIRKELDARNIPI